MEPRRFSRFLAFQLLEISRKETCMQCQLLQLPCSNIVEFIHRILDITKHSVSLTMILFALKLTKRFYLSMLECSHFSEFTLSLASDIELMLLGFQNRPDPSGVTIIFTIALIITQKQLSDNCYTLQTWSWILSHSLSCPRNNDLKMHLSHLEFTLLKQVSWDLFVSLDEFNEWTEEIRNRAIRWSNELVLA
ncbi:hypothetical protein HK096_001912, partial [Nowakowskiella sp. JEL0078]